MSLLRIRDLGDRRHPHPQRARQHPVAAGAEVSLVDPAGAVKPEQQVVGAVMDGAAGCVELGGRDAAGRCRLDRADVAVSPQMLAVAGGDAGAVVFDPAKLGAMQPGEALRVVIDHCQRVCRFGEPELEVRQLTGLARARYGSQGARAGRRSEWPVRWCRAWRAGASRRRARR